jgi:hypothetical protein
MQKSNLIIHFILYKKIHFVSPVGSIVKWVGDNSMPFEERKSQPNTDDA